MQTVAGLPQRPVCRATATPECARVDVKPLAVVRTWIPVARTLLFALARCKDGVAEILVLGKFYLLFMCFGFGFGFFAIFFTVFRCFWVYFPLVIFLFPTMLLTVLVSNSLLLCFFATLSHASNYFYNKKSKIFFNFFFLIVFGGYA